MLCLEKEASMAVCFILLSLWFLQILESKRAAMEGLVPEDINGVNK